MCCCSLKLGHLTLNTFTSFDRGHSLVIVDCVSRTHARARTGPLSSILADRAVLALCGSQCPEETEGAVCWEWPRSRASPQHSNDSPGGKLGVGQ